MPSISIVIPIYKVEKYLQRCIESVLAQDFEDWEMILVDDGSPDRCPEICDEAARKDDRIRVVHKENGGVNAARLRGFKESAGEYVMFVDADDMLPPTAISSLMEEIKKGYDIVRGAHQVFDDKHQIRYDESNKENVFSTGEDFAIALHKGEIDPYLWGGIYKKEIIEESFFERLIEYNITIGEDCLMNMFVSQNVKRVKIISPIVYLYYRNMSSVMRTKIMGRGYAARVDRCISDYIQSASDEVRRLFFLNQVRGIISRDFQKEIPFSKKDYHYVIDYIKNDENEKALFSSLPYKYTLFLRNLPLYFIYSRVFAYCKWIKGGMRDKKVI